MNPTALYTSSYFAHCVSTELWGKSDLKLSHYLLKLLNSNRFLRLNSFSFNYQELLFTRAEPWECFSFVTMINIHPHMSEKFSPHFGKSNIFTEYRLPGYIDVVGDPEWKDYGRRHLVGKLVVSKCVCANVNLVCINLW